MMGLRALTIAGVILANVAAAAELRPLMTDRPDKTESPYTVDARHFVVESDVVYGVWDAATRTRSLNLLVSNLKIGLTPSTDLQLVVTPYSWTQTDAGPPRSGLGDTLIRFKLNLWGNDSGPWAVGVMPFVKLPTHTGDLGNTKLEGGLLAPVWWTFALGWGLGAMLQANLERNAADDAFHSEFIQTLVLSRDIYGPLSAYIEGYSQLSTVGGPDWVATFDTGLVYLVTPNLQLDAGANIGLSAAADDIAPFIGISLRK